MVCASWDCLRKVGAQFLYINSVATLILFALLSFPIISLDFHQHVEVNHYTPLVEMPKICPPPRPEVPPVARPGHGMGRRGGIPIGAAGPSRTQNKGPSVKYPCLWKKCNHATNRLVQLDQHIMEAHLAPLKLTCPIPGELCIHSAECIETYIFY